MLFLTRCGAPARPFGGLRVVIFTEWIVPSAAAATASRPSSAPVGTMMRPPCALASSIRSGRGSSAPQDSTITCLPACSIGRQICSISEAGAHSTARSACSGNSSSSTIGQSIFCSVEPVARLAGVAGRDAGEASSPASRRSSRRATARPMAPRPAMAMRVVAWQPPSFRHTWRCARRQAGLTALGAGASLAEARRWSMLGRCTRCCAGRPCALAGSAFAQDWPTRPMTHGGALCRGRLGRRQRPHHGAAHGRNPRPAGGGRECRRRRRHDRLAARRARRRRTATRS